MGPFRFTEHGHGYEYIRLLDEDRPVRFIPGRTGPRELFVQDSKPESIVIESLRYHYQIRWPAARGEHSHLYG